MHLLGKFCGSWVVLWVLLDLCSGNPQCPCQAQPSNCPCQPQPAPPCNNCYNNCKNVTTLSSTLPSLINLSPFYQVVLTAPSGYKQIDSVCLTYFPLNGYNQFLLFIVYTYSDGTYSVVKFLVSDTSTPGVVKTQGFEDDSGQSSVVANSYVIGSMSCLSCTSQQLIAVYNCYQFTDCSLNQTNSDDLFVIADTPDVCTPCLNQASSLFNQGCLKKGNIQYPPHNLHRHCVTSYNGSPCINAGKVPVGDGIAYPPSAPPCSCAC